MKLFWTIIAIFGLAAAGMAWLQLRVDEMAGAFDVAAAAPHEPPPLIVSSQPDALARRDIDAPTSAEEPARLRDEAPTIVLDAPTEPESQAEPDAAALSDPEDADDLARDLVDDLLNGSDRPTADRYGSGDAVAGHDHESLPRAENPWLSPEDEAKAEVAQREHIEHSVEQQADGSLLVDGLFTVRGNGTPDAPYEISWELLMSAAETYQPRLGMNDLPERIKMLDGKHVKIAGFLMFPMATFEAKEALVMLNMWDGCCIGTMPSPYDAIEVQFTQGIPASTRQFVNYGSIEGKLIVDPYLISDWLIGLYVLEEAALKVGM